MKKTVELDAAIWRLRNQKKIGEQRLSAADILDNFYDDPTLRLIAKVLRGERQSSEISIRNQDIWVHVKMCMADGLTFEAAVEDAADTFCVSGKTVEGAITQGNLAGLSFRTGGSKE